MDKGNTALILNPFISGMKRAGADVELLYTRKLKIEPCIGDFQCWSETPGECRFHDDVPELLKKMSRADIWVFGVPVYAKLPGELQNLFNRTMPLFEPTVVLREGSLLPSRRKDVRLKKIALVSSCSYWGLENFELVVRIFEFMAKVMDVKLSRPLLRPNADLLKAMIKKGDDCHHVLEAAEEAGAELVNKGNIGRKTAEAVQKPFMSRKQFLAENG
jgi:multimeric flavodoxin WrbA